MPDNPLLDTTGLPPFGRFSPTDIEPAIRQVLDANRAAIAQICDLTAPDWDTALAPLEALSDRLNRVWSPVSHLHSVADSEALRTAYNSCLGLLSEYGTELGQNSRLQAIFQSIADGPGFAALEPARQAIVRHALREFRLAGVDLAEDRKARYKDLASALSKATTRYEENLLDATQAWRKHITDADRLRGLPPAALALAAQTARDAGLEGWLITLEQPSFIAIMTYAEHRELRHEVYRAYVTRASDQQADSALDNTPVMREILALRREMATLLGFANYAELSLERKMADSTTEVLAFLDDLARRSRPAARREFAQLQDFAQQTEPALPAGSELQAWDLAFYSERLQQQEYHLSQEQLRPYFPLQQVLQGLFDVVRQIYGLSITQQHTDRRWHDDVQFFAIHDRHGTLRGQFYLDLYARPHKRGGAWMDECRVRSRLDGQLQIPVAYLTCNFQPAATGQPALLTHNEIVTLFHEFGHGLHHMLTLVDYPSVAGINGVPWDAVELPSQLMENWCWEPEVLALLGRHHETGAPIPDDLQQNLIRSRRFQAAMQMVRQIEFALFDLRLHMQDGPLDGDQIQAILDQTREQVSVTPVPAWNRFQHGFSHIFAGGYSAGYYSYKWAEVLSADAFSKFAEHGILDRSTGEQFMQTILEQGGSKDAMALFMEFRGRAPSITPLLQQTGISA